MTTTAAAKPPSALQHSTLSALRYTNFRLYFIGQVVSLSGTWMQSVAQGWLVFHLTQSELALGIVACAAGVPALILSPVAGVMVERIPRRNILIFSQIYQMILAFVLAFLTATNMVQVWHIIVLAFLLGIINAIDAPARQTIIKDMVGTENLPSGIALNAIMFNASRVVGPAAAGIALTQLGPAWCFFVNGLSFLAVIFMLIIIKVQTLVAKNDQFAPLARLREGLAFARHHATIRPLLLLAINASLFTVNISTLLPAFADTVLHSPKEGFAALSTATGIGAVIAAMLIPIAGRRFGRGRVVTVMGIFTTLACIVVSQTSDATIATIFMGLYGFAIIMQFTTVNTLIQSEVPDEFRGRVISLYTLSWFGVSPFGALALGLVAQLIGAPIAILIYSIIGGVLGGIVALRSPEMRRLW
jgi:MFS family permease